MNKKPSKVEETSTPYAAKKPVKGAAPNAKATRVRVLDDATFRKASDKVFKTHGELFRKLAQ